MVWGLIAVLVFGVGGAAYGIAYHTGAYNKIQDSVVSGYQKVQDGAVSGDQKVINAFVPNK